MPEVSRPRVPLVAAMRSELRPLVRGLGLRGAALGRGFVYAGRRAEIDVVATYTGMGLSAAAEATRRLLSAFAIGHVVGVGIAGGIDPALGIGDLLVLERVVDERTGRAYTPSRLGALAPAGTLYSAERLRSGPEELARLRALGAAAVDMESAAIGAARDERGSPWSVLRAVSDRLCDDFVDDAVFALASG